MHRWLYGAFMTLLRAGYPPDRIEALLRGGQAVEGRRRAFQRGESGAISPGRGDRYHDD